MKLFLKIAGIISFVFLIYFFWSKSGRSNDNENFTENFTTPEIINLNQASTNSKGNLLGIQPLLNPTHYRTAESLKNYLEQYFIVALKENLISENTVVILPEYLGTWLVAANEKNSIYSASSISKAMETLVLSNLPSFLTKLIQSPKGVDKSKYALFSMKSAKMAKQYQEIFSSLSQKYKVTIVAGSIVLEEPFLSKENELKTNKGKLYNISAVFSPEGKIMKPLVKKIFPINDEKPFTECGQLNQVPIFNTKAGKMGVLICADSWYPNAYKLIENKVDFLAIPSLAGTDSIWNSKWAGYNGAATPTDVNQKDIGHLSEGEAWSKYSMGGRAPKANIHNGMNVFFTGKIWDMHPQGRTLSLINDSLIITSPAFDKGKIINFWIQ